MKPCPFCKGTDIRSAISVDESRKEMWSKSCRACGARGPLASSEEDAKRLWDKCINARTYDELEKQSDILNALYMGGVDNWEGYEISLKEAGIEDE